MTLVIAAATADGIAIAADSRSTTEAMGQQRILSDSTCKMFEVANCAVGTAGWGFLEGRNVASHVADLVGELTPGAQPPADVATIFVQHFAPLVDAQIQRELGGVQPPQPVLQFMVVGYDGGTGQVLQIGLPGGQIATGAATRRASGPPSTVGPGWTCIGQTDVVARLFLGYDKSLLEQQAAALGLTAGLKKLSPALSALTYVVGWDVLNLQDAVDFTDLAIRATAEVQRLTLGTGAGARTPGVGGLAQIAVVTPGGFEWLVRHQLKVG